MLTRSRLVFGVLFVAGSLLCGLVVLFTATRAANRVQRLEPASPVSLRTTSPGHEVLVEGRLSADNPVHLQPYGFVAYLREDRVVMEEDGDEEPGSWSVRERVTPPLLLMVDGSPVQVENDGWDLRAGDTVEVDPGGGHLSVTRYVGLRAGDQVLVLGFAGPPGEIPRVRAEFIASGTQESYVAGQRSAGWIFVAASIVVAVLGGLIVFRPPLGSLFSRRRAA